MSDGFEKLCHAGWLVAVKRMKLPDSDMTAVSTPAPEVLDIQTAVRRSVRTRFPVVSSSKIASLVTGEFLYIDDH